MRETMLRKMRSHIPAFIMLAVLTLTFAVSSDRFLTLRNFSNILMQTAPMCILAIGLTPVVIGGNLDLSGGAVIALVSVISGLLLKQGIPVAGVILAALLTGLLAGLFNGVCVAWLKMPAFILTMATQIMARGAAQAISGGGTIYGLPEAFLFLGSGRILGIPVPILLLALLFAGGQILLRHTIFGYRVCAVGEDARGASLAGISVPQIQIGVFAVAGVLYAIAAMVLTGQLGAAVSTGGEGMEMTALSCLAIGGISLAGGRGSLAGTFLGCLIIGILSNGVNMLNLSPYYTSMIRGMVIFGALLIEALRILLQRSSEGEGYRT